MLTMLFCVVNVNAADGIINVESQYSVKATVDRLETILTTKGMTIFSRIKHSENAEKIGVQFGETELIIFGNPKVGSQLMHCQQSIAIDLPQKVLIWQDQEGKVWITYNDIRYLQKRHKLTDCEKIISKIEIVLAKIVISASQ